MAVSVHRAGFHTLVQDLGRPGFRDAGVPLSGAVDRFALRVANLLVGNSEDEPALEMTLHGPDLAFSTETLVALTGAEYPGVPSWHPFLIPAGGTLSIGYPRSGCRGYLSIAGGIAIPRVLGSASVYVRGGFGGLHGRPLVAGDTLPTPGVVRRVGGRWHLDPQLMPAYSAAPTVRIVSGAHSTEFDQPLAGRSFRVTAHSDRMGTRLTGSRLHRISTYELRSATVAPGTVQVPPDGQPIVLLADAQTMGGYPQIGHVIAADLPLVAQLRAGDTVSFAEVSLAQAHAATLAREHALAMLRHGLADKIR